MPSPRTTTPSPVCPPTVGIHRWVCIRRREDKPLGGSASEGDDKPLQGVGGSYTRGGGIKPLAGAAPEAVPRFYASPHPRPDPPTPFCGRSPGWG